MRPSIGVSRLRVENGRVDCHHDVDHHCWSLFGSCHRHIGCIDTDHHSNRHRYRAAEHRSHQQRLHQLEPRRNHRQHFDNYRDAVRRIYRRSRNDLRHYYFTRRRLRPSDMQPCNSIDYDQRLNGADRHIEGEHYGCHHLAQQAGQPVLALNGRSGPGSAGLLRHSEASSLMAIDVRTARLLCCNRLRRRRWRRGWRRLFEPGHDGGRLCGDGDGDERHAFKYLDGFTGSSIDRFSKDGCAICASGRSTSMTRLARTVRGLHTQEHVYMKSRLLFPIGFACIVLLSNGCGDGGTTAPVTPVTPVATNSIALQLSSSTLTVPDGSSASTAVTLARTGTTGSVTFSVTGLPAGATVSYLNPEATNSGQVVVMATPAVAAGTYALTLQATDGTNSTSSTSASSSAPPPRLPIPMRGPRPVRSSPPSPTPPIRLSRSKTPPLSSTTISGSFTQPPPTPPATGTWFT